jgi:hypothetical protein
VKELDIFIPKLSQTLSIFLTPVLILHSEGRIDMFLNNISESKLMRVEGSKFLKLFKESNNNIVVSNEFG